jgi:hypothetical protein
VSQSGRPDLRHLIEVPNYLGARPTSIRPIRGTTLSGEPVVHDPAEGWTLVMFLSTSCDGCQELWEAFAEPDSSALPSGVRNLVVTRAATEQPEKVAARSGRAAVVLSDEAWADYGVHSGPFFVLVDPQRARVATEGVAWSVDQIASAVVHAMRA